MTSLAINWRDVLQGTGAGLSGGSRILCIANSTARSNWAAWCCTKLGRKMEGVLVGWDQRVLEEPEGHLWVQLREPGALGGKVGQAHLEVSLDKVIRTPFLVIVNGKCMSAGGGGMSGCSSSTHLE